MKMQRRELFKQSVAIAGGAMLGARAQAQAPALPKQRRVRERVEEALNRIAAPEGEGKRAFLLVFAEQARVAADAADDRARRNASLGPLDGRILSVKDVFDVAGYPTTAGSIVYRDSPPARKDAAVVQRLRAAGAVIIGRTNMTEFAFSGIGVNPHYGTPRNPYDRTRVPGGSSSGAAVAVADNFCDISVGTDSGGSVRIPSAYCGLIGFKPTQARVPRDGAIPLSLTTDTVGPLARTVQDAWDTDAVISAEKRGALEPRPISGLRLGVPRGRLLEGLDAPIAAAYEAALPRFSSAGAKVSDVDLTPMMQHYDASGKIGSFSAVEAAWFHRKVLAERSNDIDQRVVKRIKATSALSGADYVEMLDRHRRAIAAMDVLMQDYDALVLPTACILPPKIVDLNDDNVFSKVNYVVLRNTLPFSYVDTPGLSLPLPHAGPLPIGLMVIARRGNDLQLLQMGAAIEALHKA
jgi:aspartyl-tRNA(Asn)/glutamyl-tRNA(Gln) amidotransferase subunit A